MNIEYVVYYTITLLLCYGIYLITVPGELSDGIRSVVVRARKEISGDRHPFDLLFRRAGIPIRLVHYRLIRIALCLIIIIMAVILGIRKDSTAFFTSGIFAAYIIFLISAPVENFFNTNIKSPFIMWVEKCLKIRGRRYENEIFNSFVTLKNLAIVQKEKPYSADYILELLMENSGKLKYVYAETLLIYRSDKSNEAFDFFAENIGTKSAKSLAIVLSKLDNINPHELLEQIVVSQDAMREQRYTEALRKAEKNGIVAIGFSTGTFFVILLNFVTVVVIMDTLAMLGNIF